MSLSLNLWEYEVASSGFEILEPGTYAMKVEGAEFGESKSGNPMFTVTLVTDDGKPLTYYQVLIFTNKQTGRPNIHWGIPDMVRAVDPKLFPEESADRKKVMQDIEAWAAKITAGLVGVAAEVEVSIRTYSPGLDDEGKPLPDRESNQIDKITWVPKKAKAGKVTIK